MDWRVLVIPKDPTAFWTAAYTVATVFLAIIAVFGLRSITLLKRDIRNRTTREAAQTTIDRCEEIARELVPMYTAFMHHLYAHKISLFVSDAGKVSFEQREETEKINAAIQWVNQLDTPLVDETVALMNRLETWSMSFTHTPALADQAVAFEPCSSVFCQIVMTLYPMLLTQRRTNPASGPFQNTVTLFKGWYARKAQGPLLEQLQRVQQGGAKLPPIIGTERN